MLIASMFALWAVLGGIILVSAGAADGEVDAPFATTKIVVACTIGLTFWPVTLYLHRRRERVARMAAFLLDEKDQWPNYR